MVYGISGQLLAEFDNTSGALKKEYIYGVSGLLATIEPGSLTDPEKVKYITADHLGSPRIVVRGNGSVLSRHDYKPFGEAIPSSGPGSGPRQQITEYGGPGDGERQKFTSKERDTETGLDFFETRYYSSTQGRFTSPDSFGGRSVNPQTFNLYSYTKNNPLKYIDPSGHVPQDPNKGLPNCSTGQAPCASNGNDVTLESKKPTIWSRMWGSVKSLWNFNQKTIAIAKASGGFGAIGLAGTWGPMLRRYLASKSETYKSYVDTMDDPKTQMGIIVATGGAAKVEFELEAQAEATSGELDVLIENEILAARAKEIHSAVGGQVTQDRTVVAVLEGMQPDISIVRLVGSSEYNLRLGQQTMLQEGEIAVSGQGHAEVTVLNFAKQMGLIRTRVAASRGICPNCAIAIGEAGATRASPLRPSRGKN